MKHALYCLLALLPALAHGGQPAPCAKEAEACSDTGPRSAFLEAAKPAAATVADKRGKAGKNVAPPGAAVNPAAAAQAAAGEAAPAADAPAEKPAASSNPLWVVFAAGGLAGLYLYLKNDAVKKKRK